jgi:hypothetical protein
MRPGEIRVYSCAGVEASECCLAGGGSADCAGAETGSFYICQLQLNLEGNNV